MRVLAWRSAPTAAASPRPVDGTVKVWDAGTGQETLTLKGHTGAFRAWPSAPTADASPRPAGQDGEGLGRRHRPGDAHPQGTHGRVNGVAFSPDGRRIASAVGMVR